jgi:hypothetical protein
MVVLVILQAVQADAVPESVFVGIIKIKLPCVRRTNSPRLVRAADSGLTLDATISKLGSGLPVCQGQSIVMCCAVPCS